jgi:uncharacterized cupin superfamily protein
VTSKDGRCAGDEAAPGASKLWHSIAPDTVLIADPASVELNPDPIRREWILSGAPRAASQIVARSRDWLSILVVWECSAGRFRWHYTRDEMLVVVAGSAEITDERGQERRFGPGDAVFFPRGTKCIWNIEDRIRKIAMVRETVWPPLGMAAKVCKKVARSFAFGDRMR